MEVLSLCREITGEEGEQYRIRYALMEERCGRQPMYGIACCMEGLAPMAHRCRRLSAWLESRALGEALLEYLAEQAVTPPQLEDVLQEMMP